MSGPENGSFPKFNYDVTEPRLILGATAYEAAIEGGSHPSDIVTLTDLIDGQQPLPDDPVKPLDSRNWDTQRFVSHVKWIAKEVLDDSTTRITDEHFVRAHQLGIGPSLKQIGRVGGLSFLYAEADIKNTYKRGVYDGWSREDFAQYVGKIARRTPKNESLRDRLNQYARDNKGPSSKVITRRTGSIGNALEMDGLVDPNTMDREDYVDWGVRFYLANDGLKLDTDALEYLSPRRLSPSRSGIVRNFGSLEAFRIETEPQYHIERKRRAEEQKQKFSDVIGALHEGEIPTAAVVNATSSAELIKAGSQFLVVDRLLPDIAPERKNDIAKMRTQGFMKSIIDHGDGTISAADIEEMAEMLGVFSDIWPFDGYMQTLRLPQRI